MAKIIDFNTLRREVTSSQESTTILMASESSFQDGFLIDIQERFSNLHLFKACDIAHGLSITMNLECKEVFTYFDEDDEEGGFIPMISGDFSPIDIQKNREKVFVDGELQAMNLIRFQLKVLEQLVLFGERKDATHIMLSFNEATLEYGEIYKRFAASLEETELKNGMGIEMIIPTDVDTYDELIDFMDSVEQKFRQMLWRGQKTNPAFREYLKHHPLPVF